MESASTEVRRGEGRFDDGDARIYERRSGLREQCGVEFGESIARFGGEHRGAFDRRGSDLD